MNNKKVIIIAEAGVNHNGNFDMAVEMIHRAKWAGADYVKFQTAVPELVISTYAPKAEYQKETTGAAESQLEMCKAIHLPLTDYVRLKAICQEVGIGFMSTPFDLVSIVENIICQVVDDDTRENEKAFLMALMDCVIDYSASGNATVHSFLKWWDNKQNLAVSSPEGRDAVNIVTIHKSKGLEYPCVIIPFADWEMCKLDPQMWLEREVVKSLPMF